MVLKSWNSTLWIVYFSYCSDLTIFHYSTLWWHISKKLFFLCEIRSSKVADKLSKLIIKKMTPKSLSLIWRKFLPKNGYWSPLDWKKLAFASILSFSSFWLSQFCEIICKLFFKRVQCQKYRESLKMFWIQHFSNISYLYLLIWVFFFSYTVTQSNLTINFWTIL